MIKLHHSDLSLETLLMIQGDIAKYAHLKAYSAVYEMIAEVITARRDAAKRAKK